MAKRCGEQPNTGGEYTLCGRAFDDHASGDSDGKPPVVFAKFDETVTCADCVEFLENVHRNFRRLGGGMFRCIS
jgi:hypothetical protein